ncbi:hypothetical protein BSP239C_03804 [Brevibacterium sp. 239c]|uniref:hypothetical protein n=1 Tax=Brevibacterium sp. 239c TaxID=1965356 RepID=UPI000C422D8A|nr:hypothetical protein [Brevibacterium sp. 239c]SMY04334.1 hypothetical protein BSP239C_03804 [Brevibacterium sp. 239c]
MLTMIEFPVERWFDSDWPTTTQTIENAHTMAPACLVGLTGVAFIIWGVQTMSARSGAGKVSTKRLLTLIGILVSFCTLWVLSDVDGIGPVVDSLVILLAGLAFLLLVLVGIVGLPFAVAVVFGTLLFRLMSTGLRAKSEDETAQVEKEGNSHD